MNIPSKIVRSHRRTLSMHMLPDTTLLIKAPIFTSQRAIDKFIAEHQDWIEKRAKMGLPLLSLL